MKLESGMVIKLLNNFNMQPLMKNGTIWGGVGKDGIWRTCRFKEKNSFKMIPDGTAKAILIALGFKGVKDINFSSQK
jgi:hypothetical protein